MPSPLQSSAGEAQPLSASGAQANPIESAATYGRPATARLRRIFERRAADFHEVEFLAREISMRMRERLDYIRVAPERVLDAGCGPGADLVALRERYADAAVFGIDLSTRMLQAARQRSMESTPAGWRRWVPASLERMLAGRDDSLAQGDFTALPFANGVFDMLWSNLALQWNALPDRIFPEWQRTLKNGGLLMFSTLGPDTLRELRAAWRAVDQQAADARAAQRYADAETSSQAKIGSVQPGVGRVIDFVDMHDFGDMLVASGFEVPVMDTETLTITYGSPQTLLADVRRWGAYPLYLEALDGAQGLTGRGTLAALHAALEAQRRSDGKLALTFEVVYGHAWKSTPRTTAEGHAIVRLDAIGRGAPPAGRSLGKGAGKGPAEE